LSQIRKIAEEELNLNAPNESQIIYINTVTNDRTDYWEETEEEEINMVGRLINWFKRFFAN
jgi:hypothetical protein